MARVEVAAAAVADLEALSVTHSLPPDTRRRVRAALAPLGQFPLLGPELTGRWAGIRFVLGPWRWMIVAFEYHADSDRVTVLAIQDARSSQAATAE